jgi:hypothetical protein
MQNIYEVTSRQWFKHFQENAKNLLNIPWDSGYQLTSAEKKRVTASVQQFELGENAEGKTFKRKARVYAEKHDPAYMDALDLFIKEEQRHSLTLRRFLQKTEQPTLEKHWVDSVFRKLRKFLDIEVEVIVLLTAEIIAMVYYGQLQLATNSPVLITICKQILLDETRHINFQSSSLYKIRQTHHFLRKITMTAAHSVLLGGTSLLVWWQHHSVLSYYKKSYFKFLRDVMLVFYKSQRVSWGWI